ncbi:alpha-E domain-containing protein [Acinetobacter sp. MD2(2019)]|uniref:alpha-E domain-containing protein n=1 Tax=Acinetobacter sp. MD2(2019) TaxID=2605273 RepID=UPI002D1F1EAE|nr:alpha-E domain-containing protein [Acinetobacter sp. MD2(2019)]MEB3752928.1 alpha-E domain-containing protein [Acinetobacter sp. MD2(2019)]
MQLLTSNAYNILWTGRYLARIDFFCKHIPLQEDQLAQQIAAAFYLPAQNAETLNRLVLDPEQLCSFNQLFQAVYDNVQSLRGVLSSNGYAELNALFKQSKNNPGYICDALNDFDQILEGESNDLFLFFSLGKTVELLDHKVRLHEPADELVAVMDSFMPVLHDYDWREFERSWHDFKAQKDLQSFFSFVQRLQQVFEITV